MKIYLVSTYPPTKCGIAEYTSELAHSLKLRGVDVGILAINTGVEKDVFYPSEVEFVVKKDVRRSFKEAARYINRSDVDLICIQHEYGIFGGKYGSYIIDFMKNVKCPIVVTMHTVLPRPERGMRKVTNLILRLSDAVTVMSHSALRILTKYYNVKASRVYVIPHGVKRPELILDRKTLRSELGISRYFVMLTIGLMGPNKGIEYAIMAMPRILREIDNALYLIVGETHPNIRAVYGETYRFFLMRLARRLNVEDRIRFVNQFLSKEDYINYILASDVVVLPYLDRNQVSSGTLSYALSYGKVTISTPFMYAKELLSEGRGILCRFRDPSSIANAVTRIAKNNHLREEIEKSALKYGKRFRWNYVISQYLFLFKKLISRDNEGEVYAPSTYAQVFTGTNR